MRPPVCDMPAGSRDSRRGSGPYLSPFSIFVIVYTTAILLELVEHWTYPIPTAVFVVLGAALLLKITRFRFLLFLMASTFYFLYWRFPEVANHVNLIIFTNIAIIIGIVYSMMRVSVIETDDRFYEFIAPILRLMIIVTFLVAGFHKLNYDFIDPEVSCIRMFARNMWRTMVGDFLGGGIPTIAVAALVVAIAARLLWRRRTALALPPIDWPALAVPAVATLVASAAFLTLVDTVSIGSPQDAVVFIIAIIVLCWQVVEGPLLLIPRFQWVGLVLSLAVHVQLAMIRIVDFQAIALALLLTFIPPEVWRSWIRQAHIRMGRLSLHRAHAYFLINMFGGLLMLIHYLVTPIMPRQYVVAGLLFNVAVLIMLWPIISDLLSKDRSWRWNGVPVLRAPTLRLLYVMPIALLLFGLTSHFGLRTAGNFSMFSNLRTEGPQSNHFFFGNNPLKFADYQEDVVRIIEIDDRTAEIGHQYKDLEGNNLPIVEFGKRVLEWREAGRIVPVVLEYRGEIVRSDNIAADPRWRVDGFDWEMWLLDFRVIQPSGPNECRW
jgi:hypothetical protein